MFHWYQLIWVSKTHNGLIGTIVSGSVPLKETSVSWNSKNFVQCRYVLRQTSAKTAFSERHQKFFDHFPIFFVLYRPLMEFAEVLYPCNLKQHFQKAQYQIRIGTLWPTLIPFEKHLQENSDPDQNSVIGILWPSIVKITFAKKLISR